MIKNKKYKPHKITKSVSLGAMMENMGDDIKSLAESYSDLSKDVVKIKTTQEHHTEMIGGIAVNLTTVTSDLGTVTSDLETVKSDLGTVKSDVETVKLDLETVKSDVETVKSDLGTVKSDLGTVKSDVETVKSDVRLIKNSVKRKVDVEEFETLEKKVSATESRFLKH